MPSQVLLSRSCASATPVSCSSFCRVSSRRSTSSWVFRFMLVMSFAFSSASFRSPRTLR